MALQPATDDTLDVNDNDSLSLTLKRCTTAQQKFVNMLLFQVRETSKNTMLSSCWPMPKSSCISRKCCISVTERQKSCFRSAKTELRVFHLSAGVLRQEFFMITSVKIANSLTDQTKINYYQLKEKSQLWRKGLKNKPRYKIMNRAVVMKSIKIM